MLLKITSMPIRIFITLCLTGIFSGFSSCGSAGSNKTAAATDSVFYFEGIYQWNEQTPLLKDAATAAEFSVIGLSDNPEFRRYLLRSSHEQPIFTFVALLGHWNGKIQADGSPAPSLILDSLLHIEGYKTRPQIETVAGFYVTDRQADRETLLLNGSYRFRRVRFLPDGSEETLTGEWRRLSRDKIVLIPEHPDGQPGREREIVFFDPDNLRLVSQGVEGQTIYVKTYL